MTEEVRSTPDTQHRGMTALLPRPVRPFALLARFDRPIGWWLLFWPCAWGVALAGGAFQSWDIILWLLLGAIAMRGAGCVYNDIVDRDLDKKVARTAGRPLASGAVSLKAAWIWLFILCAMGLITLVQLNPVAQITACASVALVAAYPFMKRITWWPQIWLGLVFSWGVLVGWLHIAPSFSYPMLFLYLGSVFWVVGYDTIYALQDREDDALVGIKSSALRLGENVRSALILCYGAAVFAWGAAFWMVRAEALVLAALLPIGLHLGWQVTALRKNDGTDALAKFRSNRMAGLLMLMACLVIGHSA